MTDPLLPSTIEISIFTYLKNLIRGLRYAFKQLEFVPYMSRYKKKDKYLLNRFASNC